MRNFPECESHPPKSGVGLRRTERITQEIPIRVYSFGAAAGFFTEDSRTLMVNRDGALIILKNPVAPEGILWIINLENLRQDDFRVVRLARKKRGGSAEWGVECLDKSRDLWETSFPPGMRDIEPNARAA
jgi:hypothetical protein